MFVHFEVTCCSLISYLGPRIESLFPFSGAKKSSCFSLKEIAADRSSNEIIHNGSFLKPSIKKQKKKKKEKERTFIRPNTSDQALSSFYIIVTRKWTILLSSARRITQFRQNFLPHSWSLDFCFPLCKPLCRLFTEGTRWCLRFNSANSAYTRTPITTVNNSGD